VTRLEERIQAIEDRTAILELTASYCHKARTGDVEAIVELFCEDGIMDAADTVVEGRDKLLAMYREAFKGLSPLPCVHNHVVALDGDRATGICSVEIRMVQNGEAITAAGHYEDTYRRVGSDWKFARRVLILYHQVPHVKGWA
jgi:ketosteroid isomerase-like protein